MELFGLPLEQLAHVIIFCYNKFQDLIGTGLASEFEIKRELKLACACARNRLCKSRHGKQGRPKDLVDLRNVCAVEQIEKLHFRGQTCR
jgi:hypothetical protein